MSKVSAILFDFGGTLDLPGYHWLDRFAAHYVGAGLKIGREELDPAFGFATQRAYGASDTLREVGLRGLIEFLVAAQFDYLDAQGPPQIKQPVAQALCEPCSREFLAKKIAQSFADETAAGMAKSRTILSRLRSRFRLGVVSNFYGNLEKVLADAGLMSFFETVVDSSRVGFSKPDSRIFLRALERMALQPVEVAMVGDSFEKDCRPARNLGMAAVWIPSQPRRAGANADGAANFVIETLEDLMDIRW